MKPTDLAIAAAACIILAGVAAPAIGSRSRELSNRSYCAANLRGVIQSMNIYAADNTDVFLVLPFAPYAPALNTPTAHPRNTDAEATLKSMFAPGAPHHGSPLAAAWILVLKNQVSPKQFTCKDDPFAPATAPLQNRTGFFLDNFSAPNNISYSLTYPYTADGTVGKWWTAINDSSLPIMSDIAPVQGTGQPARYLNPDAEPKDPQTWNSPNHQGKGQNVGFSDGHVEWTRKPNVGQDNDNIWTFSDVLSKGPREFGGLVVNRTPLQLAPRDKPPFDTVMLPTRNATTGAL